MEIIKCDKNNRLKIDIGYKYIEKPIIKMVPQSVQIFQESKFLSNWQGVNSLILTIDEFEKIEKIVLKEQRDD